MARDRHSAPMDRVLPATRVLSLVIIPFLLVAFVLLYFWPSADDTARLFAWRISPGFTSMVLASAYLGGSYFFVRVVGERHWHRVGGGFVAVGCFATLMGVATVAHWDRFLHGNVAFWLWAALYLSTPVLVFAVWFLNRRQSPPLTADDLLLPPAAAAVIGATGLAAVLTCLFLFLFPDAAAAVWPWQLTALTARVMGAIFALGVVGIGALRDRRWSSARILLQVEAVMLVLIAFAVVRGSADFIVSRPLTWVFAAGFVALSVGSSVLYLRMDHRRNEMLRGAAGGAPPATRPN